MVASLATPGGPGQNVFVLQLLTVVYYFREESIEIHERIPNSSLLVLEHSRHGAEGADESIFKDTVLQFLLQMAT